MRVYRREWLKTVEDFFREKNRAWLDADENTLLHFLAGTPADCHSFLEVRALREAMRRRDVRYRKAKTNLQITSAAWHPDGELAVIDALETVRFYYEQNGTIQHEARRNPHRLTLMPIGGSWQLLHDVTPYEKSRLQGRDDLPPEPDAPSRPESMSASCLANGSEGILKSSGPAAHNDASLDQPTFAASMSPRNRDRDLRGRYNRVAAYKYAELWWDGFNPAYKRMPENDCTNYISQVLHAGGLPMIHAKSRSKGWWYRNAHNNWSFSWTVAHSLKLALPRLLHARQVGDPRQLKVGDIICYDWDGDGRWQHNTVVVDFDYYGYPLVNAHTVASHRRHWSYQDSYAYTARTQYAFFHIPDEF